MNLAQSVISHTRGQKLKAKTRRRFQGDWTVNRGG